MDLTVPGVVETHCGGGRAERPRTSLGKTSMTTGASQATFLYGAVVGSGLALAAAYAYARAGRALSGGRKKQDTLGPPPADIRFPLTLVGGVDRLYDHGGPTPFRFNKEVVDVFDDMVSRSVPLYSEAIDFLLYLVARYYQAGSNIYDLGCSTGTTLDSIARSMPPAEYKLRIVGVDEAKHMVDECRAKLGWASQDHSVNIVCGDICEVPIDDASVCILNYTLQFVPYANRDALLQKIYAGLQDGGILFLSEKIRSSDPAMQETCVWAYEDFKHRRGYSKEYIARKKDALDNVLVPYSEVQLCDALMAAGFDHVQTCVKWNCFVSIVAQKRGAPSSGRNMVPTPAFDSWFDAEALYLKTLSQGAAKNYDRIVQARRVQFYEKGNLSRETLLEYDGIVAQIQSITPGPSTQARRLVVDQAVVEIGREHDLSPGDLQTWKTCAAALKPWRKGPWNIYGVHIDAEWRSDLKWGRLLPHVPNLTGKVVCDLGCGNGYFMYRMLAQKPRCVVGVDPNFHAWMEFQAFQQFTSPEADVLKFEIMRGENMDLFPATFDVVFCLGVLYHTPDPVGMLRKIRGSLKRKGVLVVDCESIPGDDDVALFPKKKYTNMKGVYFVPTQNTLVNWLRRSGFVNIRVFYAEPLSSEEQRVTEWAPVHTSLQNSLHPTDETKTIEGYPRPLRIYVRAE